jgi:hypothetical protein
MFNGNEPVPQESSKNEFQALVSDDGKWLLEIRQLHSKSDPMNGKTDLLYMGFDGSDTYFCQYSDAVIGITNGRPGLIGTAPFNAHPVLSYVSAGNYPYCPFDSQKRAHILWLVYGAGKSIHDFKLKTMPRPWVEARWTPLAYGFSLTDELSSNSPYIPISLQFIRDSKLDLTNENEEYNRPEMDLAKQKETLMRQQSELNYRKTSWHDGDMAGLLKTGIFTNLNGLSLPLSFTFQTFHSWGQVSRLYEVAVTNVTERQASDMAQIDFRPPILGKLLVMDTRLRFRDAKRNVDEVIYKIDESGSWQAVDSANVQKMDQAFLKTDAISKRHSLSIFSDITKRSIVLGLFMLSTLLPIIFIFRFKHSDQNKITKGNQKQKHESNKTG